MADIRINALTTTATSSASDDYIAIDGTANGTRKLSIYSPTLGGNLTVSGTGNSTFAGTVGIQVTPKSWYDAGGGGNGAALQIGNVMGFYGYANGTNVQSRFYCNAYLDGSASDRYLLSATAAKLQLLNGQFEFYTASSGTAGNAITWNQAMTLNSNGNLLIGSYTDNALGKLQVTGSITASDTSGTGLFGFFGGSSLITGTLGAQSFILRTNNTAALTLDSSQNATFAGNATAQSASSSTSALIRASVPTTAAANAIFSAYLGGKIDWQFGGVASDSSFRISSSGLGTSDVLTISSSGNATFSGTITPQKAATASAPSYVKGAIYFDTTLNKLRVGGATGWETITSV